MLELDKIYCIDVLQGLKQLGNESIDCVITSPPYWGLRDYGTAKWEGGKQDCNHMVCKLSSDKSTLHKNQEKKKMKTGIPYKNVCRKCGAVRVDNQIGLEKTPEEYINKLVDVFREVRRVLKKEGTFWLNLGDSYCGTGNKGEWKDPKYTEGRNAQSMSYSKETRQALYWF